MLELDSWAAYGSPGSAAHRGLGADRREQLGERGLRGRGDVRAHRDERGHQCGDLARCEPDRRQIAPGVEAVAATRAALDAHRDTSRNEPGDIALDGAYRGSGAQRQFPARNEAGRGCRWRSANVFTAGPDGTIDLTRDAPVDGSYDGVDPMGLIWSMRPLDEPTFDGPVDVRRPTDLELSASAAGSEPVTARVRRRRIPDGLVRTEVRDGGLVGVMYHPAAGSRLTAVIMLAGAEAGIHEDDAALLAAHGYAVLALALAGVPGRPPTLQDIPLEYAGLAIDHLRALPFVDPNRLAVVGGSKGGEAALLIGATYPAVTGVVSVVGSGVVISGISQDVMTGSFLDIMRTPVANWTLGGEPLPYVPTVVTPAARQAQPNTHRQAMPGDLEPGPSNKPQVNRKIIPASHRSLSMPTSGVTTVASASSDETRRRVPKVCQPAPISAGAWTMRPCSRTGRQQLPTMASCRSNPAWTVSRRRRCGRCGSAALRRAAATPPAHTRSALI